MSGKIPINISSRFPLHIEADADMFGQLFAGMGDDEQVAVFRAMVEHMRPHRMQWDYISIEFEKPENAEVLDEFRSALFPSYASSQAEIERLRAALTDLLAANDAVQMVLCDGPEVPGFDPMALGNAQRNVTTAEARARAALSGGKQ